MMAWHNEFLIFSGNLPQFSNVNVIFNRQPVFDSADKGTEENYYSNPHPWSLLAVDEAIAWHTID